MDRFVKVAKEPLKLCNPLCNGLTKLFINAFIFLFKLKQILFKMASLRYAYLTAKYIGNANCYNYILSAV